MKVLKEWSIPVPWGNLALISWGNPQGDPILLIHGRQDSASTFIPLLKLLPDNYHYVGVDLPGHGKSDRFPVGVQICRFHNIHAVHFVVKHMAWNRFTCIGHSMGGEIAMFYSVVYPDTIKKLILLDVGVSLQRLQGVCMNEFFTRFFEDYYTDYEKRNFDSKVYSREQALQAVMKARNISMALAELVLERNLIAIGDDRYILSWDKRLKYITPSNYPKEYYYELFNANLPPTLLLQASQYATGYYDKGKEPVKEILKKLEKKSDFNIITVEGGHDVHLTNPDRCNKYINEFLDKDVGKSKL